MCINDAEGYAVRKLENEGRREVYLSKGVEWRLVKKCARSWIEVSFDRVPVEKSLAPADVAVDMKR
jgi:hypothetical protein